MEPADADVELIRASNANPFTLSGTNTWLIGRNPAYLIDPGPALAGHLDAVTAAAEARGGLGAILLTHSHADHAEGVAPLRERFPGVPLAATVPQAEIVLTEGTEVGPLRTLETPGHAPDHVVFVAGPVCFTGDTVLGEGSVFVAPVAGAMTAYLHTLERLRGLGLQLLCPGHGPPVADPDAKLAQYIEHRLDRERRLVAALDGGLRTVEELLDAVWADAPSDLRLAAAVTLESHLFRLDEQGRLPDGVERRDFSWLANAQV
jgi:glyoxylase-like metal-dependent hydrolase (beta-lactamase superfamily II)